MGLITLGSAVVAFATSMGGAQLINGHLSRRLQERTAQENREHSERMEMMRQRYQQALEEKKFAESERLQREITALRHNQAMELQTSNFQKNWELHQNKTYLKDAWPLVAPPLCYLHLLQNHSEAGRLPLQLILGEEPESMRAVIGGVTQNLQQIYNSQVFCYSGGWKPEFRVDTAHLLPLQTDLSGCPTLVLSPQEINDRFELKAYYWGIGARGASSIVHSTVYSEDLDKIKLDALRAHADSMSLQYQGIECHSKVIQALIELRAKEKARYSELQEVAKKDAVLNPDKLIGVEYNKHYRAFFKDDDIMKTIDTEYKTMVSHLMQVVGSVLIDVHHLVAYNALPKSIELLKLFTEEEKTKLLPVIASVYTKVLSELATPASLTNSHSSMVHPWSPVYYSLVSVAFKDIKGGEPFARQFADEGWRLLSELYTSAHSKTIEAPFHVEAFNRLSLVSKNNTGLAIAPSYVPDENIDYMRCSIGHSCVPMSERTFVKRF